MNNQTDILPAISIGLVTASFLLNTGRRLKAIEVCKECLTFLNNEVQKTGEELITTRLKNILRKVLRSEYKLATKKEKQQVTET